jgi:hypothetical protein
LTGQRGAGGWCDGKSTVPAIFEDVLFERNVAEVGGGFFAIAPCQANMTNVVFRQNSAIDAGAGLATGDGVKLNISQSIFESNGASECPSTFPPASGGAMMVGVERFVVDKQCGVSSGVALTEIKMRDSSVVGNIALRKGGGILVEQGILSMEVRALAFHLVELQQHERPPLHRMAWSGYNKQTNK